MRNLISAQEVIDLAFAESSNMREDSISATSISVAEIKYIRPAFGAMFPLLGEKYADFTNEYVKPALAYFVKCEIIASIAIDMSNSGVAVANPQYQSAATDKQRQRLYDSEMSKAKTLLDFALEYIATHSEEFPDFSGTAPKKHYRLGGLILGNGGGSRSQSASIAGDAFKAEFDRYIKDMQAISEEVGDLIDSTTELADKADEATKAAAEAVEATNDAIQKAETATKNVNEAIERADEATTNANNAAKTASEAVVKLEGIGEIQEKLTLSIKDNGNIIIGNLDGQTKEFMPATPSGDPMHYAYEAVGAVYNSTDNDIAVPGIYGDTIIHKAGFWLLNEVGDLSNDDMAVIVANPIFWNNTNIQGEAADSPARTTIPKTNWSNVAGWYGSVIKPTMHYAFFRSKFVTIRIFDGNDDSLRLRPTDASGLFRNCSSLTKVLNVINFVSTTTALNTFAGCTSLSELRIAKLKISLDLHWSPLSVASAIYLLQNADATAQFTVTFRADRQAIYEANADFMTAKNEKPNITILYQ